MPDMPTGPNPTGMSHLLPEQLGRKIDCGDIAHYALPERDCLQVLDVPPKRHFVVGTAVDIFEQEMRQPRLGERAKIADSCGLPSPTQLAKLGSSR